MRLIINTEEKIIADIFASLLNIPNVGIYDNFFELGGHSLLATQVISRLRKSFGVDISLRSLFTEPTVANISKFIEKSNLPLVRQLQVENSKQLEGFEEIEL